MAAVAGAYPVDFVTTPLSAIQVKDIWAVFVANHAKWIDQGFTVRRASQDYPDGPMTIAYTTPDGEKSSRAESILKAAFSAYPDDAVRFTYGAG